jgi:ribosomal protein S18 acetylase RimI-like enzyme
LSQELVRDITSQRGGSLLVADGLVAEVGTEPGHLDRVLDDARSRVVVGTLDQAVIGFAMCHVVDDDQARRGVLDACYVEPEARGVGVGRLLLEALVSWLEARGCEGVDGVALPGDRGAKNFYESAGFKARMITMYRRMD